MEYTMNILFLYATVVSILQCSMALQQAKTFTLQPNPTIGPQRLSVGWTAPSLISCIARCMIGYQTTCQNVMYNKVTHLCTPGQWGDQSEPVPSVAEGDLYITCPRSLGFDLYTDNNIHACLYKSPTKLNYTEAKAACQKMGAHLYTINNVDKLNLLRTIHAGTDLWVGLDDLENEGKYVAADDGKEISATLMSQIFVYPEPNTSHPESDCVMMYGGGFRRLNDNRCHPNYDFFCEKTL